MGEGVLLRYREYLSITPNTPMVSLGEGDTPLVRSRHLGATLGCEELYFKLEGCNPTGSFKDRGMVMAVAKAIEAGHDSILCASTGNTSAAAAAYGAYCGLAPILLVPKGTVAEGKISQAIAYGARIILLRGAFDQALTIARALADRFPMTLVNSVNPHRLEGQKTAAFEIIDVLGDAPDCLCLPVGNAGNITAYWAGFKEYQALGKAEHLPRMMGYQAAGAAPIVLGHPVEEPTTIASALRIGNPANWRNAELARDESGGEINAVSDDAIMDAYRLLAQQEGVFCEPASAASLAGLMQSVRAGLDLHGQRVVCVITGTGLKDASIVTQQVDSPLEEASADLEEVEWLLGLRISTTGER
jgi:threonine synthase